MAPPLQHRGVVLHHIHHTDMSHPFHPLPPSISFPQYAHHAPRCPSVCPPCPSLGPYDTCFTPYPTVRPLAPHSHAPGNYHPHNYYYPPSYQAPPHHLVPVAHPTSWAPRHTPPHWTGIAPASLTSPHPHRRGGKRHTPAQQLYRQRYSANRHLPATHSGRHHPP